MPQARCLVILNTVQSLAEVIEADKVTDLINNPDFHGQFSCSLIPQHNIAYIKDLLHSMTDVTDIQFQKQDLNQSAHGINELAYTDHLSSKLESTSIRVNIDRIESLMNSIGELSIGKIRLLELTKQIGNKDLFDVVAQIDQLTANLQDEMMEIRLLPLEYLFSRFPRMVRDLAEQECKEVNLLFEGTSIGVDRGILDEIHDPLLHIIRNAICHGIENPETRLQNKKNKEGTLKICAYRERHFVVVNVTDDGAGLDSDRIKKKALELDIISKEESEKLPKEDTLKLITHPGFSLSSEMTERSGRGVGMNVVLSKVNAIGGYLSIESEKGKGTSFTVKLPLSMAIVQAMLIGLSKETFAIPLTHISETIKINPANIKHMGQQEIISHRDSVLPLVRLKQHLGFNQKHPKSDSQGKKELESVVVVESGTKKAGLIVDNLVGQQEIVVKSLKGQLNEMKGVSGATILGSGKVAMILDIGDYL